ncbi:FAD-binding domain-containing protein [Xylariaceae sp. FL1272]|nr:FAD-binding domain-containing protein [Xylariaceae sp. FL1272]
MRRPLWPLLNAAFLACLIFNQAVVSEFSTTTQDQSTMENRVKSFHDSLGLSEAQAQLLRRSFEESNGKALTSEQALQMACLAGQMALGEDNVDLSPLKQTLAGENWSLSCVLKPRCIFQPVDSAGVSKAIKIIRHYQVKFSVRSGGHSPNPGWANNSDGILLDLQKLDQISVNADKSVASVGPGSRWGNVLMELDQHGTSVIGGRIPVVGVGGLMLGGGYFHFSGEYGMSADNVQNFEVVLADGTITNANAAMNDDLFWALKGGGSNFGIVTRFDLLTVPVRDIWYSWTAYTVDQAETILDAFVEWQENGMSDLKSTVALIMSLDSVVVGLIYSAPADNPSAFAPFYGIPSASILVPAINGTVKSLTDFLANTFSNIPARHDYRSAASKIDAQLYKEVWGFWKVRAQAIRASTGANQTFTIQPIPKNLAAQGTAKGGNPMGILAEDHQWWTTVVDWQNAADDDKVRSVSIETAKAWETFGQNRSLSLPHIYMNDASRDQNPLATYGSANLARLKHVAKKYDEDGIFQKLQVDGFLLSKA